MYVLRDYQQTTVDKALLFFSSGSKKRPIVVAPTGSGKSVIIAHIVKQLTGRVLILQPSKELLEQNYTKYANVIQDHDDLEFAGIYSASVGIKELSRVTFATIGSVYKKPELFQDVDYILIDECHFVPPSPSSMYSKFLNRIDAKVLGFTATPFRPKTYSDPFTRKKYTKLNLLPRERPKFFNDFLHVVQISEMYEAGYLSPVKYISMNFDGSFLELNTTGAEYSDDSMRKAMDRNDIIGSIPGILKQAYEKGQQSSLVFTRTVQEARDLNRVTPFSAHLSGDTKKRERKQLIGDFRAGNVKTMFNVGVLTTGFDYEALDTILIARPTASLSLFMQMIGRGMRIASGKDHCTVVDLCGNLRKFGRVDRIRFEEDPAKGWVMRNDERILSGVRIDSIV